MKKNKILAVICSALAVFSAVSLPLASTGTLKVEAATYTYTSGDFDYKALDDGTVFLSGYHGSDTSLQIPSTLDGKKVTQIGSLCFLQCKDIKYVTIPEGVTSIGHEAFGRCENLVSVTLPDSLTSIGDYAFNYCEKLQSITLPDRLTSIGDSAFNDCISLSSITIPGSVKSIGRSAFAYCEKLKSVTLENGIKTIGKKAFMFCNSLQSLIIPASVEEIGDDMVLYCDMMKSISVDSKNKNYSSQDGVLFNKTKTELITYPCNKNNTSYSIPSSVKTIKSLAFYQCNNLSSLTIPIGVVEIEESAFYNSDGIKSIKIPYTVTLIGDYAFNYCDNMKSIDVDSTNKNYSSKDGVLFNKTKTVLIQYPCGKESSGYTVPDSVDTIKEYAFHGSTIDSVTVPAGVTTIEEDAFNIYYLSVIYGYKNTAAEKYAKEYGIKFVALGASGALTGDVNGDNEISINDATLIQKGIAGSVEFTTEQKAVADANGDGEVNISDVTVIQKFAAGLIETI